MSPNYEKEKKNVEIIEKESSDALNSSYLVGCSFQKTNY